MSKQITITLPDEVYQRAERFARLANRDVASILVNTLQLSIPPIRADVIDLAPVSLLRQGSETLPLPTRVIKFI